MPRNHVHVENKHDRFNELYQALTFFPTAQC
jgi:hypothetical protein